MSPAPVNVLPTDSEPIVDALDSASDPPFSVSDPPPRIDAIVYVPELTCTLRPAGTHASSVKPGTVPDDQLSGVANEPLDTTNVVVHVTSDHATVGVSNHVARSAKSATQAARAPAARRDLQVNGLLDADRGQHRSAIGWRDRSLKKTAVR
jgi:hypothetical protein